MGDSRRPNMSKGLVEGVLATACVVFCIVCLTASDGKNLYVWKITPDDDAADLSQKIGMTGFCLVQSATSECSKWSDVCDNIPDVEVDGCNPKDLCISAKDSGVGLLAFYILVILTSLPTMCLSLAPFAKRENSLQLINGYLVNTGVETLRRWSIVTQSLTLLFAMGAVGAEICLGVFALEPGCDNNNNLDLHAGTPVVLTSLILLCSISSLCAVCCCKGSTHTLIVTSSVDNAGLVHTAQPTPVVHTFHANPVQPPPPLPPATSDLPAGWSQWYDDKTEKYYYQSPQGEVTWDKPSTMKA